MCTIPREIIEAAARQALAATEIEPDGKRWECFNCGAPIQPGEITCTYCKTPTERTIDGN